MPARLFVTLWAAAVKAAPAEKTNVTKEIDITDAKRMMGVLLRRSLFMELVRGSIQLHDIVRDYVLSKVEQEQKSTGGLQVLQRCFVSEFLASQESWEAVGGEKIPRSVSMCPCHFSYLLFCWCQEQGA